MFPVLFRIGALEFRVYSIMLMIGIFTALFFVSRRAVSFGIEKRKMENFMITTFIAGILGARLYYVVFNWSYFKRVPSEIFAVWHGGLAIHGGLIMGVLVTWLYSRKLNFNLPTILDLITPFILLGQGIGRFGNFANGEAHGVPVITPFSVIFKYKPEFGSFWSSALSQTNFSKTPNGISALYDKILSGPISVFYNGKEVLLKEFVPWGVSFPAKHMSQAYQEFGTMPVHPTFFYEMILNLIGAIILITMWRKDVNVGKGKICAIYMIMYGVIRGFVTFFRADDLMFGYFRAPHVASLLLIIGGVLWLLWIKFSANSTKSTTAA